MTAPETPREVATEAVRMAWLDAGVAPDYHYAMQHELRQRWPVLAQALDALAQTPPDEWPVGHGWNLPDRWKPGERVELVSGGYGDLPRELRPGTVDAIVPHHVTNLHLRVRFDDGETREINPDVMRHIR